MKHYILSKILVLGSAFVFLTACESSLAPCTYEEYLEKAKAADEKDSKYNRASIVAYYNAEYCYHENVTYEYVITDRAQRKGYIEYSPYQFDSNGNLDKCYGTLEWHITYHAIDSANDGYLPNCEYYCGNGFKIFRDDVDVSFSYEFDKYGYLTRVYYKMHNKLYEYEYKISWSK